MSFVRHEIQYIILSTPFSIRAVRPLEVDILFNNQPLSADRQYEVQCQAIGSRPPSIITWWMNGVALVAQPSKVSNNYNYYCRVPPIYLLHL
jgi:hypothetical protein